MKVNMTPNPLDVVTIHASQGDTEARQWGFELHNNGELIDTSEVTEQMFFKAYKGGTEQLLPENTSTPTTSPFLGNIKYPQGLLADQEFTYRQSPTESDGLAKITDIKGNTLVWNQLINATDGSGTIGEGVTYTTSNGVITLNGTPTSSDSLSIGTFSAKANHKYLLKGCASGGSDTTYQLFVSRSSVAFPQGNRLQDTGNGKIVSALGDENNLELRLYVYSSSPTFSNTKFIPQIFDLTAMGLDSLTNAEILQWFANYFPLSYYSYNQGSLLSFNGNGIKTVGFNQWDEEWEVGAVNSANGANESASDRIRSKGYIRCLPNTAYYYVANNANLRIIFYDANKAYISYLNYSEPHLFTTPSGCCYMRFNSNAAYGNTYNNDICINISNTELNGTYEPYTSSTLSLPISAYFPNGMKSAGSVYDELTESKAITRIGAVDMGSLDWRRNLNVNGGFNCRISDMKLGISGQMSSVICPLYETINTKYYGIMNTMQNMQIAQSNATQGELYLINTSYSDVDTFKQAMSGVYLYYELKTPTETSFSTASLVTENAEIPLSNEDGVLIGKCTEQLSAEPGFHDAKIKLADSDGECYSNKLQLHVERKP